MGVAALRGSQLHISHERISEVIYVGFVQAAINTRAWVHNNGGTGMTT